MPSDPRDYKLDITSASKPSADEQDRPAISGQPFLNVHFRCCNIYRRVYRSADGSCYRARCPRCGRGMRFEVGPGGSDTRFFVVD